MAIKMAKQSNSSHLVSSEELEPVTPMTPNQEKAFNAWADDKNLVLAGSAGTGKTFMAMNFALQALLTDDRYRKVMILRSMVSTRDPGHLPGTKEEKEEPYKLPYKQLCEQIFGYEGAWGKLTTTGKIHFETTSYIRGTTFDQTIIIVDEMQNLNFHELDSVITRVGNDCKIILCGDYKQSDFRFDDEKAGLMQFLSILELMSDFRVIEFEWADIVRSGFVRDYIMTKELVQSKRF